MSLPTANIDDILAAMEHAKKPTGQFPWVDVGTHKLILANFNEFDSEGGKKVVANMVYYESTNPALVGAICTKMFSLHKGPFPKSFDEELSALTGFITELSGNSDQVQARPYAKAMLETWAGRGILISCTGVRNAKNTYTATYFSHLAGQTPESISASAAYLDTVAPMSMFPVKSPGTTAQPVQQPMAAAPVAQPVAAPTSFGAAAAVAQPVAQAPAAPAFKIPGL